MEKLDLLYEKKWVTCYKYNLNYKTLKIVCIENKHVVDLYKHRTGMIFLLFYSICLKRQKPETKTKNKNNKMIETKTNKIK